MDLIIIHDKGWACTNKSETGSRLSEVDGQWYRHHTIHADNVFNCDGIIEKGIKASFLMDNEGKKSGWLCDVQLVNKGIVKAQRVKELTELEIKGLINKIKK